MRFNLYRHFAGARQATAEPDVDDMRNAVAAATRANAARPESANDAPPPGRRIGIGRFMCQMLSPCMRHDTAGTQRTATPVAAPAPRIPADIETAIANWERIGTPEQNRGATAVLLRDAWRAPERRMLRLQGQNFPSLPNGCIPPHITELDLSDSHLAGPIDFTETRLQRINLAATDVTMITGLPDTLTHLNVSFSRLHLLSNLLPASCEEVILAYMSLAVQPANLVRLGPDCELTLSASSLPETQMEQLHRIANAGLVTSNVILPDGVSLVPTVLLSAPRADAERANATAPDVESSLNDWVQAADGEHREDAARIIMAAWRSPQNSRLMLSRLGLTSLPDMACIPPHVTTLMLDENELTHFPHPLPRQVVNLSVSNNPIAGQLDLAGTSLENIDIAHCPITDIAGLPDTLRYLNAISTPLRRLPNLLPTNAPLQLQLSGTWLSALPANIGQLHAGSIISLQQCDFLLEESVQALARPRRNADLRPSPDFPNSALEVPPLNEVIDRWSAIADQALSASAAEVWNKVLAGNPRGAAKVSLWLSQMQHSQHYLAKPQEAGQRILGILERSSRHERMVDALILRAGIATTDCADRADLTLYHFEEELLSEEAIHKKLSPDALFKLARGLYRSRQAMEKAIAHAEAVIEQHNDPNAADGVEFVLRYLKGLSSELDLPVKVEHMFYERVALLQGASDAAIKQAGQEILSAESENPQDFHRFLAGWKPWVERIDALRISRAGQENINDIKAHFDAERERVDAALVDESAALMAQDEVLEQEQTQLLAQPETEQSHLRLQEIDHERSDILTRQNNLGSKRDAELRKINQEQERVLSDIVDPIRYLKGVQDLTAMLERRPAPSGQNKT